MSDNTITKNAIVIERIFDAPIDLIWQLWTQPAHFKQWYGPQGFTIPTAELDVRVGGKRLICMESPDGSMKIWLTGEYVEIVPNERLIYTESMADEQGNIVTDKGLPAPTTITVQLEDLDGRTRMVMTHAGLPVDEQGASEGWEQAFDKMAEHIDTLRNDK